MDASITWEVDYMNKSGLMYQAHQALKHGPDIPAAPLQQTLGL